MFGFRTQALLSGFSLWRMRKFTNVARCRMNDAGGSSPSQTTRTCSQANRYRARSIQSHQPSDAFVPCLALCLEILFSELRDCFAVHIINKSQFAFISGFITEMIFCLFVRSFLFSGKCNKDCCSTRFISQHSYLRWPNTVFKSLCLILHNF